MGRKIKIFAGIMVFFGVVSVIFLLTVKRKTQTTVSNSAKTQTSQLAVPEKKATAKQNISQTSTVDATKAEAKKALTRNQWQQCKNKTMADGTTLFWNVQISEAIPAGGTYAKGVLNNEISYPVRVNIKPGISIADKINQRLVAGKLAVLRGACTDVAADGAVIFQAF
jgi:hypothetical protein